MISILLPSFNKPEYVREAICSVVSQTFKDWELWIIENSTDGKTKDLIHNFISSCNPEIQRKIKYIDEDMSGAREQGYYPTSVIINKYYEIMQGEYFFYISDDDVIGRDCLLLLYGAMGLFKSGSVTYCVIQHQALINGKFEDRPDGFKSREIIEAGTMSPINIIDGGQILFHRYCLKEGIEKPYYPFEMNDPKTSHCDGEFLHKLSRIYDFYPVDTDKPLVYHRRTPISTWRGVE